MQRSGCLYWWVRFWEYLVSFPHSSITSRSEWCTGSMTVKQWHGSTIPNPNIEHTPVKKLDKWHLCTLLMLSIVWSEVCYTCQVKQWGIQNKLSSRESLFYVYARRTTTCTDTARRIGIVNHAYLLFCNGSVNVMEINPSSLLINAKCVLNVRSIIRPAWF